MIVCKLIGGLGNQMFQYSYACALAKQLDDEVCLDISYYSGKKPDIFKLNIKNKLDVNDFMLCDYKKAVRKEKIYHIKQKIIRILCHERIGERLFKSYSKKGYYFNFDPFYYPSIKCEKENKYVYGYFQGENYFKSVEELIRKQFTISLDMNNKIEEYINMIKESNAVALHVRMGDYTKRKNKYLNVCTDQYYINAIQYIRKKVINPRFFVFTNDIASVKKKHYIPKEAVIVAETENHEDLFLMKNCKHFIISGSTFSWWGAYLSEDKEKIIVAPEIWMTTLRAEPAIYLPQMIKIGR